MRVIKVGSVNSRAVPSGFAASQAAGSCGLRDADHFTGTLDAVDAPFINYHAGINPKYRGQHPAYWARVEGDDENAGVTVHLVDKGVDTGEVIYQAPVAFSRNDNIATYQYVQLATGMTYWRRRLVMRLPAGCRTTRVELPSKLWFPPTLWQYVWNGTVKGRLVVDVLFSRRHIQLCCKRNVDHAGCGKAIGNVTDGVANLGYADFCCQRFQH